MIGTEEQARQWPISGWKFGHSKGYVRCLCPSHPNADAEGYVYEHVYRASIALKRGLNKGETAHHVDGDPANNRNNNLVVCTHRYHRNLHVRLARSPDWPQFHVPVRGPTKRAWVSSQPRCKECGSKIAYASQTGLCVAHYWLATRAASSECRVKDCDSRAGSRSGLCLRHLRFRDNKRRYKQGWDFDAH